jgi:hypothetical protein
VTAGDTGLYASFPLFATSKHLLRQRVKRVPRRRAHAETCRPTDEGVKDVAETLPQMQTTSPGTRSRTTPLHRTRRPRYRHPHEACVATFSAVSGPKLLDEIRTALAQGWAPATRQRRSLVCDLRAALEASRAVWPVVMGPRPHRSDDLAATDRPFSREQTHRKVHSSGRVSVPSACQVSLISK